MKKKALRVAMATLTATAAGALSPAALADLALARSKNCMSCHAVDRKVLGPAFKDVAAKYKDNKGAATLLTNKIMKGGAGTWGPVPMPANNQVSEAEAQKLAAWVLATQ